MFCNQCGSKMIPLKAPAWTMRYKCSSCIMRLEVLVGDKMGGQEDDYYYRDKPFDEEIEVNLGSFEK